MSRCAKYNGVELISPAMVAGWIMVMDKCTLNPTKEQILSAFGRLRRTGKLDRIIMTEIAWLDQYKYIEPNKKLESIEDIAKLI